MKWSAGSDCIGVIDSTLLFQLTLAPITPGSNRIGSPQFTPERCTLLFTCYRCPPAHGGGLPPVEWSSPRYKMDKNPK